MLDRQTVRLFRERMQEALDPLGNEIHAKITVGNASYTPGNASFKIEVALVQADGQTINKSASNFKRMAARYSLAASDLGRQFSLDGKQFIITGLNPRCRRYPILARGRADGKIWKLPLDAVLFALRH
jgi:hypothetical protein